MTRPTTTQGVGGKAPLPLKEFYSIGKPIFTVDRIFEEDEYDVDVMKHALRSHPGKSSFMSMNYLFRYHLKTPHGKDLCKEWIQENLNSKVYFVYRSKKSQTGYRGVFVDVCDALATTIVFLLRTGGAIDRFFGVQDNLLKFIAHDYYYRLESRIREIYEDFHPLYNPDNSAAFQFNNLKTHAQGAIGDIFVHIEKIVNELREEDLE